MGNNEKYTPIFSLTHTQPLEHLLLQPMRNFYRFSEDHVGNDEQSKNYSKTFNHTSAFFPKTW